MARQVENNDVIYCKKWKKSADVNKNGRNANIDIRNESTIKYKSNEGSTNFIR